MGSFPSHLLMCVHTRACYTYRDMVDRRVEAILAQLVVALLDSALTCLKFVDLAV